MQGVGQRLCDLNADARLAGVLDLSFDGLQPEEKEMFLDIAGVCANREKYFLEVAWKSIYRKEAALFFENLESADLVSVVDGCVTIQNVLRDLGRKKIRSGYAGSHVWTEEFSKQPDMVGFLWVFVFFSIACNNNLIGPFD